MSQEQLLSRRELIAVSAALSGVALFSPLSPLVAAPTDAGKPSADKRGLDSEGMVVSGPAPARTPTPEQGSGPFYPVKKPADQDTDLTVVQGKPGKAQGQVIYLMGRVLNLNGEPVRDAEVQIWQANSFGRYTHPSDQNPAPLDPNFQGFGFQATDAVGRFRFKTIKPGAYPVAAEWTRPPHIHFAITSKSTRLITQMYFVGEPLNEKDLLFKTVTDKESLLTKLMPPTKDMEPEVLIAAWEIVLPQT